MTLTNDERVQCEQCLDKLNQTKAICLRSIEYLFEQQREIDECLTNLRTTRENAQAINKTIYQLNDDHIFFTLCCQHSSNDDLSTMNVNDHNQLMILPFPTEQIHRDNVIVDFHQLEHDFDVNQLLCSLDRSRPLFVSRDDFEHVLHREYTLLFHLAKKLTESIQIVHDTIELLGQDVQITLTHMQSAQPRIERLLQCRTPFAYAQIHKNTFN
jgi:hypothetical protein